MDLISKELTTRGGACSVVYFKELTAGQQNQLLKGQVVRVDKAGSVMERDVQLADEQSKRLVVMTCCDEHGKPLFSSLQKLFEEPAGKIQQLIRLAGEAQTEFEEGAAGNA